MEVTEQHAVTEKLTNHYCDLESMNTTQLLQQMWVVRNVKPPTPRLMSCIINDFLHSKPEHEGGRGNFPTLEI